MLGHGQQSKGASVRWGGFQDRIRNPSLTLILVLELSIIFLSAPLAAKGLPLAERILDVSIWAMVVLIVLLSHRWGAIVSIALASCCFQRICRKFGCRSPPVCSAISAEF